MNGIEEIVHIVPLGHEVDRVVKPFERFKANRVHLLAITESKKYSREMLDKQKYFLEVVKKKLEEKGIEVLCKNVDMFDILEVMKNVSEIIQKEKSENNIVYVNMSGAGRLTSVGATLAAMAHNARVYYVVADRYSKNEEEEMQHGLSICEKLNVVFIENFQLQLPDDTGLKVLVKLCEKEKGMKTKEIFDFLRESNVEGFEKDYTKLIGAEKRKTQQGYLIKLNKGILDRLEKSGYIVREKLGRYNTIKITESGKYVAHISGLLK
jgi:uncharacterized protein YktA (UPF0223 family)